MRRFCENVIRREGGSGTGFTFVELLIVVTMLGILAMMVVPRITRATDEAREAALVTDLLTIRKQVQLYKAEHFGRGPQYDETGSLAPPVIVNRMTSRTDPDGKFNVEGKCGPYLKKWPVNPFSDPPNNWLIYSDKPASPRTGTHGWYLDYATGIVSANSKIGAEEYDQPAGY